MPLWHLNIVSQVAEIRSGEHIYLCTPDSLILRTILKSHFIVFIAPDDSPLSFSEV